jgi:LEA14-like dessication related protein
MADSVRLLIYLGVENRNDSALYLYSLNYTIDAFGEKIAFGDYEGQETLQAMGSTQVKVPITVDAKAARNILQSLLQSEQYTVTVTGVAKVGTDLNTFTIPFKETKNLAR